MKSFLRKYRNPVSIGILFLILGLLRLNDLSLYTDCTRYLIWGNSVAQGKGFVDDTQPVPEHYIVNAPFYSVILVPVLFFFPLSLTAAKIWTLLWGIFALVLFHNWLRFYLDKIPAFVATLFFALNPLTLILSTEVLSETCFLSALFGVFIYLERLKKDDIIRLPSIILICIISLVILVREVSLALVAASIIYLLYRKRWRISILAGAGAFILFGIWTYRNLVIVGVSQYSQSPNLAYIFRHFVTPPGTTLFNEIVQRVLINYNFYSPGLGGMLLYYFPTNLIIHPSGLFISILEILSNIRSYFFLLFLPLLITGIIKDFYYSKTALLRLLFVVIYLCIILVYPVQDARFVIPLIPFAIYYLITAVVLLINSARMNHSIRFSFYSSIIVLLLFPNLISIYEILRTNISYQKDQITFTSKDIKSTAAYYYFSTPWSDFGELIDRKIQRGTIIATPDKRIVPFAPKQKFIEINYAVPLPQLETILRNYAVEYLLAPTIYDSISEYQVLMDESERFRFELEGSEGRLNIYHVVSKLEEPLNDLAKSKIGFEQNKPLDLFRYGRLCLKNERYNDALAAFNGPQSSFSQNSNIKYQLLVIYTFLLDSAKAASTLQELYSLPMATSYIEPAQIYIRAMNSLLNTQKILEPDHRAPKLCEIARLYWNLGYKKQAYRIIREAVQSDSSYFTGILWAWNYGNQIGDTKNVSGYLKKLLQIDKENPIVKSFERIASYQKILISTDGQENRSMLHVEISKEFDSIDLMDEALDEAQRAICESPENTKIWLYLASLFEKYRSPLAAIRANEKAFLITGTSSNLPLSKAIK